MSKIKTSKPQAKIEEKVQKAALPSPDELTKQEPVIATDPVVPVSSAPVEDVDGAGSKVQRQQYFSLNLELPVKHASADQVTNAVSSTQEMLMLGDSAAGMFYESKDVTERDKGYFPRGNASVLGKLSFPKLPYVAQNFLGVPTYLSDLGNSAPKMLPFSGTPTQIKGVVNGWRYPNTISTLALLNVSGLNPGVTHNQLQYHKVEIKKGAVTKEQFSTKTYYLVKKHANAVFDSLPFSHNLQELGLPLHDDQRHQSKTSAFTISSYYGAHRKYAIMAEEFPQAKVELFMKSGSSLASTLAYLIDGNTLVYLVFNSIATALQTAVPLATKNFRMDPAHAFIDRLNATQKGNLISNLNLILEASSKLPVNTLVVDTYNNFTQVQGNPQNPYGYDSPWVTPFVALGMNLDSDSHETIAFSDTLLTLTANSAVNSFNVPTYKFSKYLYNMLSEYVKNEHDASHASAVQKLTSPHNLLEMMTISPYRISKFMYNVIKDLITYQSDLMRKIKQVLVQFEQFAKTSKVILEDTIFKYQPFAKVHLKPITDMELVEYSGLLQSSLNVPVPAETFWRSDSVIIARERFEDDVLRKRAKVGLDFSGKVLNQASVYQYFLITDKKVEAPSYQGVSEHGVTYDANLVSYWGLNDVISLYINSKHRFSHPIYDYAEVSNDRLIFSEGANQSILHLPYCLESYAFGFTEIYQQVSTKEGRYSSYFNCNSESTGAHLSNRWSDFVIVDSSALTSYFKHLGVSSVLSPQTSPKIGLQFPYVVADALFDLESQTNLPASINMLTTRV